MEANGADETSRVVTVTGRDADGANGLPETLAANLPDAADALTLPVEVDRNGVVSVPKVLVEEDADLEDAMLEVLAPVRLPERDPRNGRYRPGSSGNSRGRPREALATLCRREVGRRKLVQALARTALDKNTEPMAKLAITKFLIERGFGPAQAEAAGGETMRIEYVKRLHGISESDV